MWGPAQYLGMGRGVPYYNLISDLFFRKTWITRFGLPCHRRTFWPCSFGVMGHSAHAWEYDLHAPLWWQDWAGSGQIVVDPRCGATAGERGPSGSG